MMNWKRNRKPLFSGIFFLLLLVGGTVHAGATTYKYDVQGRVIEIDYPNGAIVKYTYDNAGNRTQVVKQAGS